MANRRFSTPQLPILPVLPNTSVPSLPTIQSPQPVQPIQVSASPPLPPMSATPQVPQFPQMPTTGGGLQQGFPPGAAAFLDTMIRTMAKPTPGQLATERVQSDSAQRQAYLDQGLPIPADLQTDAERQSAADKANAAIAANQIAEATGYQQAINGQPYNPDASWTQIQVARGQLGHLNGQKWATEQKPAKTAGQSWQESRQYFIDHNQPIPDTYKTDAERQAAAKATAQTNDLQKAHESQVSNVAYTAALKGQPLTYDPSWTDVDKAVAEAAYAGGQKENAGKTPPPPGAATANILAEPEKYLGPATPENIAKYIAAMGLPPLSPAVQGQVSTAVSGRAGRDAYDAINKTLIAANVIPTPVGAKPTDALKVANDLIDNPQDHYGPLPTAKGLRDYLTMVSQGQPVSDEIVNKALQETLGFNMSGKPMYEYAKSLLPPGTIPTAPKVSSVAERPPPSSNAFGGPAVTSDAAARQLANEPMANPPAMMGMTPPAPQQAAVTPPTVNQPAAIPPPSNAPSTAPIPTTGTWFNPQSGTAMPPEQAAIVQQAAQQAQSGDTSGALTTLLPFLPDDPNQAKDVVARFLGGDLSDFHYDETPPVAPPSSEPPPPDQDLTDAPSGFLRRAAPMPNDTPPPYNPLDEQPPPMSAGMPPPRPQPSLPEQALQTLGILPTSAEAAGPSATPPAPPPPPVEQPKTLSSVVNDIFNGGMTGLITGSVASGLARGNTGTGSLLGGLAGAGLGALGEVVPPVGAAVKGIGNVVAPAFQAFEDYVAHPVAGLAGMANSEMMRLTYPGFGEKMDAAKDPAAFKQVMLKDNPQMTDAAIEAERQKFLNTGIFPQERPSLNPADLYASAKTAGDREYDQSGPIGGLALDMANPVWMFTGGPLDKALGAIGGGVDGEIARAFAKTQSINKGVLAENGRLTAMAKDIPVIGKMFASDPPSIKTQERVVTNDKISGLEVKDDNALYAEQTGMGEPGAPQMTREAIAAEKPKADVTAVTRPPTPDEIAAFRKQLEDSNAIPPTNTPDNLQHALDQVDAMQNQAHELMDEIRARAGAELPTAERSTPIYDHMYAQMGEQLSLSTAAFKAYTDAVRDSATRDGTWSPQSEAYLRVLEDKYRLTAATMDQQQKLFSDVREMQQNNPMSQQQFWQTFHTLTGPLWRDERTQMQTLNRTQEQLRVAPSTPPATGLGDAALGITGSPPPVAEAHPLDPQLKAMGFDDKQIASFPHESKVQLVADEQARVAAGGHPTIPPEPVPSAPGLDLGKATIDRTKYQEGLDAGLTDAQARDAARVSPEVAIASSMLKNTATPPLPADIAKSNPRYGYGNKQFEVQFDSPIDKALYIVAQKTPSKADERFMSYLRGQFPGQDDNAIRGMGRQVRDVLKGQARTGEDGAVLRLADQGFKTPAPSTTITPAVVTPAHDTYNAVRSLADEIGADPDLFDAKLRRDISGITEKPGTAAYEKAVNDAYTTRTDEMKEHLTNIATQQVLNIQEKLTAVENKLHHDPTADRAALAQQGVDLANQLSQATAQAGRAVAQNSIGAVEKIAAWQSLPTKVTNDLRDFLQGIANGHAPEFPQSARDHLDKAYAPDVVATIEKDKGPAGLTQLLLTSGAMDQKNALQASLNAAVRRMSALPAFVRAQTAIATQGVAARVTELETQLTSVGKQIAKLDERRGTETDPTKIVTFTDARQKLFMKQNNLTDEYTLLKAAQDATAHTPSPEAKAQAAKTVAEVEHDASPIIGDNATGKIVDAAASADKQFRDTVLNQPTESETMFNQMFGVTPASKEAQRITKAALDGSEGEPLARQPLDVIMSHITHQMQAWALDHPTPNSALTPMNKIGETVIAGLGGLQHLWMEMVMSQPAMSLHILESMAGLMGAHGVMPKAFLPAVRDEITRLSGVLPPSVEKETGAAKTFGDRVQPSVSRQLAEGLGDATWYGINKVGSVVGADIAGTRQRLLNKIAPATSMLPDRPMGRPSAEAAIDAAMTNAKDISDLRKTLRGIADHPVGTLAGLYAESAPKLLHGIEARARLSAWDKFYGDLFDPAMRQIGTDDLKKTWAEITRPEEGIGAPARVLIDHYIDRAVGPKDIAAIFDDAAKLAKSDAERNALATWEDRAKKTMWGMDADTRNAFDAVQATTNQAVKDRMDQLFVNRTDYTKLQGAIKKIFPFVAYDLQMPGMWANAFARKPQMAQAFFGSNRAIADEDKKEGLPQRLQGSLVTDLPLIGKVGIYPSRGFGPQKFMNPPPAQSQEGLGGAMQTAENVLSPGPLTNIASGAIEHYGLGENVPGQSNFPLLSQVHMLSEWLGIKAAGNNIDLERPLRQLISGNAADPYFEIEARRQLAGMGVKQQSATPAQIDEARRRAGAAMLANSLSGYRIKPTSGPEITRLQTVANALGLPPDQANQQTVWAKWQELPNLQKQEIRKQNPWLDAWWGLGEMFLPEEQRTKNQELRNYLDDVDRVRQIKQQAQAQSDAKFIQDGMTGSAAQTWRKEHAAANQEQANQMKLLIGGDDDQSKKNAKYKNLTPYAPTNPLDQAAAKYQDIQLSKYVDPTTDQPDYDAWAAARRTYLTNLDPQTQSYVQQWQNRNRTPVEQSFYRALDELNTLNDTIPKHLGMSVDDEKNLITKRQEVKRLEDDAAAGDRKAALVLKTVPNLMWTQSGKNPKNGATLTVSPAYINYVRQHPELVRWGIASVPKDMQITMPNAPAGSPLPGLVPPPPTPFPPRPPVQ